MSLVNEQLAHPSDDLGVAGGRLPRRHLGPDGGQVQQEGLDRVRVQQELLSPHRADGLALVDVVQELGDERVDELDAELREVLPGGGRCH